jgi:hypothetical protein
MAAKGTHGDSDRVPEELVSLLAAVSEAELPAISKGWANTEEAMLDRWSAEDAAAGIRLLSGLCRIAAETGKAVFLRVSL